MKKNWTLETPYNPEPKQLNNQYVHRLDSTKQISDKIGDVDIHIGQGTNEPHKANGVTNVDGNVYDLAEDVHIDITEYWYQLYNTETYETLLVPSKYKDVEKFLETAPVELLSKIGMIKMDNSGKVIAK